MNDLNNIVKSQLNKGLFDLSNLLKANIISYTGPFYEGIENDFLNIIERLVGDGERMDKIYIIITSNGGSASVVERFVNILRHHYKEVNFIIPDYAFSAGTIFCMSGDNILMDYFSVLGPIDPQVPNKEGKYVPALGYLDKINDMLDKSKRGELTPAEFIILKDFDLAELRSYEQARELSVTLLKKWLVKYKFKNWEKHRTDKDKKDKDVTKEEKEERAEEIATALSDNNQWKTHGRPINIESLKELRLEIYDYSKEQELRTLIRNYYELLTSYLKFTQKQGVFIHTKNFF